MIVDVMKREIPRPKSKTSSEIPNDPGGESAGAWDEPQLSVDVYVCTLTLSSIGESWW